MRREVIERLSDPGFLRRRRLQSLFILAKPTPSNRIGLAGVVLLTAVAAVIVWWLNKPPAHSEAPAPPSTSHAPDGMRSDPRDSAAVAPDPILPAELAGFTASQGLESAAAEEGSAPSGEEAETATVQRDGSPPGEEAEPPASRTAEPPEASTHEQSIEVTLHRGDTLFDVLMEQGIPAGRIHELLRAAGPLHDLGRMRRGQTFSLIYDERDGRILRFQSELDDQRLLIVERVGEELHARKEAAASKANHPVVPVSIEVTLKQGDTLFDVLRQEGIPASHIHELVVAAQPVYDLKHLMQGKSFKLVYDEHARRVLRFALDMDGDHLLVVERLDGGLQARKETFDYQIQHRTVSGMIRDSLFMAADQADLPPALTLALAEIFAWDIDFHVDIRAGDNFRVLFEEKYLDGRFSRYGNILAAAILNQGQPFWAFRFEGSDGRVDYYDRKGRSLQKIFLKSPLKYTRISSRYSRRRLHPILKIYRPHLGIDYAAPPGTPVRTIGDGRVVFAGWKGGYGRFLKVRHNGIYTSTYGHLHRFARGIRRGKYVRQGQVIGYVGSTGLSTGPHLDFRLLKNGRFINPLKVKIPNADPVTSKDRVAFRQTVERRVANLDGAGSQPAWMTNHRRR